MSIFNILVAQSNTSANSRLRTCTDTLISNVAVTIVGVAIWQLTVAVAIAIAIAVTVAIDGAICEGK